MNDVFIGCFDNVQDPRVDRTKKHLLIDILAISLCAVLAGALSYEEIQFFGETYESWFKKHLSLINGIPSVKARILDSYGA